MIAAEVLGEPAAHGLPRPPVTPNDRLQLFAEGERGGDQPVSRLRKSGVPR